MTLRNALLMIFFTTSCHGETVDKMEGKVLDFQIIEKLRIPQTPSVVPVDFPEIKARFFIDEITLGGNEIKFDKPLSEMIPNLPDGYYSLDLYLSPRFGKIIIDYTHEFWIYDFREKKLDVEYRKKCKYNNLIFLSANGSFIGTCDIEEFDAKGNCYNIKMKIIDVNNRKEEQLNLKCARLLDGEFLLANDGKTILSIHENDFYLYKNNTKTWLRGDDGIHYISDDIYSLEILDKEKRLRLSRLFPVKKIEEIIDLGDIKIEWEEIKEGLQFLKNYLIFKINPSVIVRQTGSNSINVYDYMKKELREVTYIEERDLIPRDYSMSQLNISKNGKYLLAVDGTKLLRIIDIEKNEIVKYQMVTNKYSLKGNWVAFVYRDRKNEEKLKIISLW